MRKIILGTFLVLISSSAAARVSYGHTIYQCGGYRVEDRSIVDDSVKSGGADSFTRKVLLGSAVIYAGDMSDVKKRISDDLSSRVSYYDNFIMIETKSTPTYKREYSTDNGATVHSCKMIQNKWTDG